MILAKSYFVIMRPTNHRTNSYPDISRRPVTQMTKIVNWSQVFLNEFVGKKLRETRLYRIKFIRKQDG